MSETPEIPNKFVRVDQDGQRREFEFAPFTPGQEDTPEVMIIPLSQLLGKRSGDLRHLSYEDPPHGMTETDWREMLSSGARLAQNEEHFVRSLVQAMLKDLVLSHGCHPEEAIPAIIEFGKKVYAEVTGTV